jgi:hypothetical protein
MSKFKDICKPQALQQLFQPVSIPDHSSLAPPGKCSSLRGASRYTTQFIVETAIQDHTSCQGGIERRNQLLSRRRESSSPSRSGSRRSRLCTTVVVIVNVSMVISWHGSKMFGLLHAHFEVYTLVLTKIEAEPPGAPSEA